MSRLGDKIRQERNRKGMSTKEVAKKCGVSESFLIDVELGKKIINDSLASRILKVIGSRADIIDEFEEAGPKEDTVKDTRKPSVMASAVPERRTTPVEPTDMWKDALANIIKRVPVYDMLMQIIEYKDIPVQGGKIEGFHPDKVFYVISSDNALSGFRIRKNDRVFVVPQHELVNNAIMFIEYGGKRFLRKVRRIEGNKILLLSHDREVKTETVDGKDMVIIGQCIKVEFTIQ